MMKIPLIDLKIQYENSQNELDKVRLDVLSSSKYIIDENVKEFE